MVTDDEIKAAQERLSGPRPENRERAMAILRIRLERLAPNDLPVKCVRCEKSARFSATLEVNRGQKADPDAPKDWFCIDCHIGRMFSGR